VQEKNGQASKAPDKLLEEFFKAQGHTLPEEVISLVKGIILSSGADRLNSGKKPVNSTAIEDCITNASHQITAASKLSEKASIDILAILGKMQNLIDQLPDNANRSNLNTLISSAYELFTFEDIACQHIQKALSLLNTLNSNQSTVAGDAKTASDNVLLNGPALPGEASLSQTDIDNLLNN
jgi:hypothetical protein